MGILGMLKQTGKVAKNVGKQVADDVGGVVKKTAKTIDDSKSAYTYMDFLDDGGKGWDETISLIAGNKLKMTSKAGMIGLGGYGVYQAGKTGINLSNKKAQGQMIEGNNPFNRLSQNPGHTSRIDNLGATGDTVFGMHRKR